MKFIYFDLGNVILNFDHRLAARNVAEVSQISEQAVWETLFGGDLNRRFDAGEFDAAGFHQEFCRLTGTTPAAAPFEAAFSRIFRINRSLLPVIAALRAAGHRMGILSNTCPSHWEYVLREYPAILQASFCEFALSYEMKLSKPDVRIYELAAKQAGVAPQDVFYCDDIAANVAGACQAGFDAVLFETTAKLVADLRKRGVPFNY